jgi:hypothetical protein
MKTREIVSTPNKDYLGRHRFDEGDVLLQTEVSGEKKVGTRVMARCAV